MQFACPNCGMITQSSFSRRFKDPGSYPNCPSCETPHTLTCGCGCVGTEETIIEGKCPICRGTVEDFNKEIERKEMAEEMAEEMADKKEQAISDTMRERRLAARCLYCGRPLGFWSRLQRRTTHKNCIEFTA